MQNIITFKANKGNRMKAMKKKFVGHDWEYEQEKKREKRKHKAFREQRKNRNQWETENDE